MLTKPENCICKYPEIVARNMTGHEEFCPVHIEFMKIVALENKPEGKTYTLTQEQMEEIVYQLNSFMRLMGYGGEYEKIVKIIISLKDSGFDFSKYHRANMEINRRK